MRRPRLSTGWMMFGVALACVPLALLRDTLGPRNWTGRPTTIGIGLWPSIVGFSIATALLMRAPRRRSRFLLGFAVGGWASVVAFVVVCRTVRADLLNIPAVFYFNEVDPRIFDSEYGEIHYISMLSYGLLLSLPGFLIATLAGLLARYWLRSERWIST